MTDNLNPSVYKDGWSNGAQVIDISEHLNGNGAQIVQYVARSTRIDGVVKGKPLEDLKKARWFIDREISRLESDDENLVSIPDVRARRSWHSLEDVPSSVTKLETADNRFIYRVKGSNYGEWSYEYGSLGSLDGWLFLYDEETPVTEVLD